MILLLQNHINVNQKNLLGNAAIHLAAREGYEGIVNELLKRDSDVNAENNDLRTSLHLCVENDHQRIMAQLISHGANVHAQVTIREMLFIIWMYFVYLFKLLPNAG